MGTKYKVNEDGSVTKINRGGGNNNNNNSGGNNSGCGWIIVVAILIGVAVYFFNNNSSDSAPAYDDSTAIEAEAVEEVVAEEVVAPSVSYLSVSDDDIMVGSDGGSFDINVSTDGDWHISVDPASWGHISKYSSSLTLRIDPNNSSSSRTDYFEIKAGDYSKRINITQRGDTSPRAEIENIWVDHNVYQDGYKGMRIHVKFTVDNMNGRTIYAYALFYYGDNTTPLHDQYGSNLSFSGYGTPSYDNARFDDFKIFVPYAGLNMQPGGGTTNLSFDISIRNSNGTELDRENNTQFTYSN